MEGSRGVRRIARTADPLLVLQVAEANGFFALADCLFVDKCFHSHAATIYAHQRTIARVARGWLARHGTVYDGEEYLGQDLLKEGESEFTSALTMVQVNYGPGVAEWNPPARGIQVADLNVLMQRINKWRTCQRRKGEMLQVCHPGMSSQQPPLADSRKLISTLFSFAQDDLKAATVVDTSCVIPYMLVRYRLFHAFISARNVWRGMQSDCRHFLDVHTADGDDDEERQHEADPDISMTVTRNVHMFYELCID